MSTTTTTTTTRADLVTAYEDPCVRIASCGNVLVAVWRDPPDRARTTALRALRRRIASAHSDVVMLHVIDAGTTSPLSITEEGRRGLMESIHDGTPGHTVVGVAIEGTSFFVAAWRSILSGLTLLTRPAYPFKLFGRRDEAAAWIARETSAWSEPATAPALLTAVERVGAGLRAP